MSLYDYKMGLKISGQDYHFYALIQASMRQADANNLKKLQLAFPEIWEELQARYDSPGGKLEGDK